MASPITCHVLNTVSGTPAANLTATLTLLKPPKAHPSGEHQAYQCPTSFRGVTNEDGRVKEWQPNGGRAVQDLMSEFNDGEKLAWSIKLQIGPWYEERNIECFWPEIEVKFYVKKGERHYHIPVLVGPWTYTTYRGS